MLQSIEKQQKKRKSPNTVTVMFHDRKVICGDFDSFFSRARARGSLSGSLAATQFWGVDGLSLSLPLKVCLKNRHIRPLARLESLPGWVKVMPNTHRADRPSLSRTEEFSAERPMARSALAVLAANPNTRSPQAGATPTKTLTEQRCWAAA